MRKSLLLAAVAMTLVAASNASAQQATGPAPAFNPFASFSLNRFSFNTLGLIQVAPTNPFLPAGSTSGAAPAAAAPEATPLSVAPIPYPPFRPPVRSPYKSPPRPPFFN